MTNAASTDNSLELGSEYPCQLFQGQNLTLAQTDFVAMLSESALYLFSHLHQTPSGTTPGATC